MKYLFLFFFGYFFLTGCDHNSSNLTEPKQSEKTSPPYSDGDEIPAVAYLQHNEMYNPEAVIPPQCYTRTDGKNNPCYVCHQSYSDARPNVMKDIYLQGLYDFSEAGMTNSWKNLFKDRSAQISEVSDNEIKQWINTDNYSPWSEIKKTNTNVQSKVMKIKNLAYPQRAFDKEGFALDNSRWVAFNYKPFPSAFWPTNGSTDDVMIRLPNEFQTKNGVYNHDIYRANLALLEMTIKGLDSISVNGLNENFIGLDLNNNNNLENQVDFIFSQATYLGDANTIPTVSMLYPEGTEFLHTVRYVGVNDQGEIYIPPRMKEIRYMKKHAYKSPVALRGSYFLEAKEKHLGQLPQTVHIGDRGIDNRFGWTINAFIEDQHGELRQQNEQELAFCNGCHKTVGSTIDQTFSFARKVEGADGWGYIDLKTIVDVPSINESQGEYLTYMERVGGGDEFRQNKEMLSKWFSNGLIDKEKVQAATSIYELITPSETRAMSLNKAYREIVKEQSFIFGRDVVLTPASNVIEVIDSEIPPLEEKYRFNYDIRLQWTDKPSENNMALKY